MEFQAFHMDSMWVLSFLFLIKLQIVLEELMTALIPTLFSFFFSMMFVVEFLGRICDILLLFEKLLF